MFSAQSQFGHVTINFSHFKPRKLVQRRTMILPLKETRSWDVDNLSMPGFVFVYGSKKGFHHALVSDRICNEQKSWKTEERCSAVLFGSVMVIEKDFEENEKFMAALVKEMQEGRKKGARRFLIAGDLNIEGGLLCMDDDEETQEVYGPQCW